MRNQMAITTTLALVASLALVGGLWQGGETGASQRSVASLAPTLVPSAPDDVAAMPAYVEAQATEAPQTRSLAPSGLTTNQYSTPSWSEPSNGYRFDVQQQDGTICETTVGACVVTPQPIGSPCRCSEVDGALIGQITR